MSLYASLADLPLHIDRVRVDSMSSTTRGGWVRTTALIRLRGPDHQQGLGEDATYIDADQHDLLEHAHELPLAGKFTLDSFSRHLDGLRLFANPPVVAAAQCYRRWAFESAALDLALKQAGMSLAQALRRQAQPVRFVVSLALDDPPSLEPLRELVQREPDITFKLDLSESWTPQLVDDLARMRAVEIVDFKGQYRGSFRAPIPDPQLYHLVAHGMSDTWIEDPALDKRLRTVLTGCEHRFTWDAPIHSVADIMLLEQPPAAINMKPARFGFVAELLRAYELCEARGIPMYGGGQLELGPGRDQIQCLASLFHADAPNDVAPSGYNASPWPPTLPHTPIAAHWDAPGFGVRS
jgi:L-alanine-DL-glutamate epimerase-like enolase superfamily enzyme